MAISPLESSSKRAHKSRFAATTETTLKIFKRTNDLRNEGQKLFNRLRESTVIFVYLTEIDQL